MVYGEAARCATPEAPRAASPYTITRDATNRGKVLIRESVNVAAAGGPAPMQDWKPHDLSPDLSKAMTRETLAAARDAINMTFGVLPGLTAPATTGPMVREAQRHLAQWVLQPIATGIAEEATDKLGSAVTLDMIRPLQAFDAGGPARALKGALDAFAAARAAGLSQKEVEAAARFAGVPTVAE